MVDPESTTPARRVRQDGTVAPIEGESAGLTVYGTYGADRHTFNRAAELTPELAELLHGVHSGHGTTTGA